MKGRIAIGAVVLPVALAAVACATASSAPPRPAVVDMKRAAMECRDGRAARADLDEKRRSMQALLDKSEVLVVEALTQVRAAAARGEDTREMRATVQREAALIAAEYLQLKKELSAEEERRAAPIYARLRAALPVVAQAHHATITESSGPPAGNRILDLTPEVIRAVDAQPSLPVGSGK